VRAARLTILAVVVLARPIVAAEVGVTTLTFTKDSVTSGEPRVLETVLWYPAVPGTGIPDELGRRAARPRRGRRPLVVFSHGACGRPTEATYLTMELARRGFVVAAPPHPGNTQADFPECASVATTIDTAFNRVPDVRFIIDSLLAEAEDPSSPFARRLRPESVAIAGLSFGGFTTLLAAQQEPRLRAALSLVPGGTAVLGPDDITIPTMVIGAERDVVVTYAESERAYERLAGPRFLVKLLAANHLSVVDDCFDQNLGIDLCVPDDIGQDEAHRLVLRYALPFMKRYLANQKAAARKIRRPDPGVELTLEPTPPVDGSADATP